jgi:hypothetical protein
MTTEYTLTEQEYSEAHKYFTACEFMLIFKENPKDIVDLLKKEFPQDIVKLRTLLDREVSGPVARLLQQLPKE